MSQQCQRSKLGAVLLSLAVLFGSVLVMTTAASAGTSEDEQKFVSLINQYRSSNGVGPLTVDTELTVQSRAWAKSMADRDTLEHAADISIGVTSPWTALGENVGVNGIHDIDQLFAAFVASPSHQKNLVDPRFNYVGVGVAHDADGKIWTTHRFMAASSNTPATSPPATNAPATTPTTAAPAPTPAPTATPTTQAPAAAPTTTAKAPTTGATTNSKPSTDSSTTPSVPGTSPSATSPATSTDTPIDLGEAPDLLAFRVPKDGDLIEQILLDLAG